MQGCAGRKLPTVRTAYQYGQPHLLLSHFVGMLEQDRKDQARPQSFIAVSFPCETLTVDDAVNNYLGASQLLNLVHDLAQFLIMSEAASLVPPAMLTSSPRM